MIRTAFQRISSTTGCRAFSKSAARATESKQIPEIAKRQGEKLRKEEKSKEQRPSPISDEAKRKFEEINKKIEQGKK
ncbi:hypothetical protein Unana1_06126 [Umbelopsis nana]